MKQKDINNKSRNEVDSKSESIFDNHIEKYIDEYNEYLKCNLYSQTDFFGKNWIRVNNKNIASKQFDKISYLFKKLFVGGYFVSEILDIEQYDFLYGVNKILKSVYENSEYLSHYTNTRDNNHLFYSTNLNDFEGFWSELAFLDYSQKNKLDIIPFDDPNFPSTKTKPDFFIKGNINYYVEIKTFTDAKFHPDKLSFFSSLELTEDNIKFLIRKYRDSVKQLQPFHPGIVVVDISLYWELYSNIIGRILLNYEDFGDELKNRINSINVRMDGNRFPFYLQVRQPYTGLVSMIYYIGDE